MTCCTYLCTGGKDCPVRAVRGTHAPPPQPITTNSDGSSNGHDDDHDSLLDDTGQLICQGAALALSAVVALICLLIFL